MPPEFVRRIASMLQSRPAGRLSVEEGILFVVRVYSQVSAEPSTTYDLRQLAFFARTLRGLDTDG